MDWATTSGIVLALAGLGVAMVSVPRHPEFWVARLCFAAAALVFAGKGLWWAMSFGQPIWLRIAVTGAIGAVTLIALVEGWLWVNRHERATTDERGAAKASVAARAFFECALGVMPKIVPPDGRIHVLVTTENGGGLADFFGAPGSELALPIGYDTPAEMAYRCRVTNYSNAPLFDVHIGIELIFLETVHDKDSPSVSKAGRLLQRSPRDLTIPKIDVGSTGAFTFYVYNPSNKFCQIDFPDYGQATRELSG